MEFKDMTIKDFADGIAGENTIAGGGSVSALAGAYGAALMSMVGRKTIQNKNYESVKADFINLVEEVNTPREIFLNGIQEDITAFETFEKALALPKNTDEEKASRFEAMQAGLKEAALAPMRMAEEAAKCLETFVDIVERGNKNAASDALVGVLMMRAAILGSVYNVRINLQTIKDQEFCTEMSQRAAELQAFAEATESKILGLVPELTQA